MLCALARRSRLSVEATCWLSALAFENSFPIYPSKRKEKKRRKTSPVMSCPSPPWEWKEPGLSQRGASHALAPAYCMLSWCADDNAITRISVSRWEPSGCRCLAPIAFTLCLKLKKQSPAAERMSQILLSFFFFFFGGGQFWCWTQLSDTDTSRSHCWAECLHCTH